MLTCFQLGNSEKERQHVNTQIANRRTKSGFTSSPPQLTFALGLARFEHDSSQDDGGNWVAMNGFFTIHENNRALTSQDLALSLLYQAQAHALRPQMKTWVFCGKTEDWTLAHTNPTKALPRDIAPWMDPNLLSAVIDAGSYEQKGVAGSQTKIFTIWLYNTPEAPMRVKSLTPPPKTIKKEGKKEKSKGKRKKSRRRKESRKKRTAGENIQTKIKLEPLAGAKRQRPISAEISPPVTRRRKKLQEELDEGLSSGLSSAGDGAEDTRSGYHSLSQLTDNAKGSGGEGPPAWGNIADQWRRNIEG